VAKAECARQAIWRIEVRKWGVVSRFLSYLKQPHIHFLITSATALHITIAPKQNLLQYLEYTLESAVKILAIKQS